MEHSFPNQANYPIYLGIWIDWSKGRVFGSTLTLTSSDANLLIAAVALSTTLIASQLWQIISFTFHALFCKDSAQDALYHQRQAILRNNSGPIDTAKKLFQVSLSWKNKRAVTLITPILASAILTVAGLAVATTFSSRVATGSQVLISGGNCGILNFAQNYTRTSTVLLPLLARRTAISASYAQQCYDGQGPTTSTRCPGSQFIQQQLKFVTDQKAGCPFAQDLCINNTTNLWVDTGLIDSHTHFGLNAPPNQRIWFREVLHCAPLNITGRKLIYNHSDDRSYAQYRFGEPLKYQRSEFYKSVNATYEYPNDFNTQPAISALTYAWPDYTLE